MLSAKPKVEANNPSFCSLLLLQPNSVNTDTEETTESVGINGESVLSGSCY